VPRVTVNNSDDMIAVTDLVTTSNIHALVSAALDTSFAQAQVTSAYGIPHVSLQSKGAALSDRANFPSLIRMSTYEGASGRTSADFAVYNEWTRVGVLYEQSDYCTQWYLVRREIVFFCLK
jgi:hypothetical protein